MTLRPGGIRRLAAWAGTPRPAAPAAPESSSAHCELCPVSIGEEHRHLLQLDERRILCVCETCWALHSGDPEYRPTGGRTLWLEDFELSDELWASFQIPIGLAFMLRSGATGAIAALYPSPVGATECELELTAWDALCVANPVLERLEPDAEALLVNRLASPPQYAIAPVDACYRLVGIVKSHWEGITGGREMERAVDGFFEELRAEALVA